MVFEVLTEEVRGQAPWCMMYADDVVLCAETKEEIEQWLENWRVALESRGMKVNRKKTEYMRCDGQPDLGEELKMNGDQIKRVECFKYLGSTIEAEGGVEREVNNRIQSGWKSWREVSGVLCDRKMPVKLKGKVFKTVVRPAMLYGLETVPLKKTSERRLDVAEMKMLRWTCGVTRKDKIRNVHIRGTVKVAEASRKVQEARLRWYGHIRRRDEEYVGRKVLEMEVPGRRRRGRPKTRWRDCVAADIREKDLEENAVYDRGKWRRLIKNSDPI